MYAAFYDPTSGAIRQRGNGSEDAIKATADHLGLLWLEISREDHRLPLETAAHVDNATLIMGPVDGE